MPDKTKEYYEKSLQKINCDDPFRAAKISYVNNELERKIESVDMICKPEVINKRKALIMSLSESYSNASSNAKVKPMFYFHFGNCNSAKSMKRKSIAMKRKSIAIYGVNVSSRFISSKFVIYDIVSIPSFAYIVVDVFSFTNSEVSEMCDADKIINCFVYLILTGNALWNFFLFTTSLVQSARRRLAYY